MGFLLSIPDSHYLNLMKIVDPCQGIFLARFPALWEKSVVPQLNVLNEGGEMGGPAL